MNRARLTLAARALLLVAATLLAHVPAMRGGYVWDDDAFVTDNPVLKQGWEGLRRIWFVFRGTEQYYPLAYSSFWLEFHAWGLNPTGSHIVNRPLSYYTPRVPSSLVPKLHLGTRDQGAKGNMKEV